MANPLLCSRCQGELESDDAISIIEGVCAFCRRKLAEAEAQRRSLYARPGEQREATRRDRAIGSRPERSIAPSTPFLPPRPPAIPTDYTLPPLTEHRSISRSRQRRRDLIAGFVPGLIVSAIAVAYFTLHGGDTGSAALDAPRGEIAVKLRVLPPNASVTVDGQTVGPPDSSGRLAVHLPADGASMRWLEVSAVGYHSVRRPLSVLAGVEDVTIELLQKPYDLVVRSTPPDADVWINNELKGRTPLTLAMSPGAKPLIEVKRIGYHPLRQELPPPTEGNRRELDLRLERAGPVLRVESDPPGAEVRVDNETRGRAPLDVQLAPARLGGEVVVEAALDGHRPSRTRVAVAPEPSDEPIKVHLKLATLVPQFTITTRPPGGRVLVDGKDAGVAPIVIPFTSDEAGRTVTLQGLMAGSSGARQTVRVPAAGEDRRIELALEFDSDRVLFVLSAAPRRTSDFQLLIGQIAEQIHALASTQQFAVVSVGEDGVESWPGGSTTHAATCEQKIRAYDWLRSLRPARRGSIGQALKSALALHPKAVWVFSPHIFNRAELLELDTALKGAEAAVHLVSAESGPRDGWLARWAAGHNGTLTILGQSTSVAAAGGPDGEE